MMSEGEERYGRLVVLDRFKKPVGSKPTMMQFCRCRCDCGTVKDIRWDALRTGRAQSCGCRHREIVGANSRRHGGAGTKLYKVWQSMVGRCHRQSDSAFRYYGARGIVVCDAWRESFEAFRDWADQAGYEEGLEIDRIDNDGSYEPGNCRWTTSLEQSHNRRSNRLVTAFGETRTMERWYQDDRCVVSRNTLKYRLDAGWAPEDAIARPGSITPRFATAFGETKRMSEWARDSRCVVNYYALVGRIRVGWNAEDAIVTPLGIAPQSHATP